MMNDNELKAKELLKKYNQEHIIAWMDKVDNTTKERIVNQVLNIDFEELKNTYNKIGVKKEKTQSKIEPFNTVSFKQMNTQKYEGYKKVGEQIFKEGKFAVLTMAGGQGTRLRA